eukprot:jgi/Chlat1/4723/Chrsp30S04773
MAPLAAAAASLAVEEASVDAAVVVLGCRVDADGAPSAQLAGRVAAGVAAWSGLGGRAWLVCTGHNSGGPVTEAAAAAKHAEGLGAKKECIVQEELAANTLQNALYTRPILEKLQVKRAFIVTSDFHVKRTKAIFAAVYEGSHIELEYASAPTILTVAQRATRELWEVL